MDRHVLYLGDTALDGAGSYLAGVLNFAGIDFKYLASDQAFSDEGLTPDVQALIISDYPASNFTASQLERVAQRVKAGMGLLMIGGWESFTGSAGGYQQTLLKEVLPVRMSEHDDRVNYAGPCVVRQDIFHKTLQSLPFMELPPCIAGYNRLTAKRNALTILSVEKYRVKEGMGDFAFVCEQVDPLLVEWDCGKGRVLAYAGDVAPHWAGGFVDWGDQRLTLRASGAGEVEVGNWYVEFFSSLVRWVCR